ncbi:hypothetical protein PRUPE_1G327900 [Prunus persica]|uniref:ABC transporter family G domain-containing protein n=1 Tax=Prunus persica TaxID=3760 RepID=A0A251R6U6_PRUPE|nr:hypothetical protein PRUPE_1G327900 [Prunus persica]
MPPASPIPVDTNSVSKRLQKELMSLMSSVLLPVVMTLIATRPQDSEFLKILAKFCYPKWALEAFVIANAESNLLMEESNFVNPRTEMEVFAHAANYKEASRKTTNEEDQNFW